MNSINAIIIDDEKEACENLEFLLKKYTGDAILVKGVLHSTKEAEKMLEQLKPDVVFLDIEMPNENAFQFLERLETIPFEIIFVTAYDEFAIRAFRFNAVDYILKPIHSDDLVNAVEKLKDRIVHKKILVSNADAYHKLANEINKREAPRQIILKDSNQREVVPIRDILYVKAMGSYSQFVFKQGNGFMEMLMSSPIAAYDEMLAEISFFRVHRSFLVNCGHIRKIIKGEAAFVQLSNDMMVPVGRRRFAEMMQFLKTLDKNV